MKHQFYKSSGIALITGALLIILTMVLHPAGGNLEYLINNSKTIMYSHAMAICSLPLLLFGFYGLSHRLLDQWKLSILAFISMGFGLISAMFAATINGLALPYFLNQHADQIEQQHATLTTIIAYGFALNKSLDYIFITACCLAIILFSIIIIYRNVLWKWIGYLGILIFVVIGVLSDFVFTNLIGFRIFTFSIAGWVLASGISLSKSK